MVLLAESEDYLKRRILSLKNLYQILREHDYQFTLLTSRMWFWGNDRFLDFSKKN